MFFLPKKMISDPLAQFRVWFKVLVVAVLSWSDIQCDHDHDDQDVHIYRKIIFLLSYSNISKNPKAILNKICLAFHKIFFWSSSWFNKTYTRKNIFLIAFLKRKLYFSISIKSKFKLILTLHHTPFLTFILSNNVFP